MSSALAEICRYAAQAGAAEIERLTMRGAALEAALNESCRRLAAFRANNQALREEVARLEAALVKERR